MREIVKMFNSFDGDFRRRPIVSIRGASKKESKAELLERAQRERNEREASCYLLDYVTKLNSISGS